MSTEATLKLRDEQTSLRAEPRSSRSVRTTLPVLERIDALWSAAAAFPLVVVEVAVCCAAGAAGDGGAAAAAEGATAANAFVAVLLVRFAIEADEGADVLERAVGSAELSKLSTFLIDGPPPPPACSEAISDEGLASSTTPHISASVEMGGTSGAATAVMLFPCDDNEDTPP